MQVIDDTGPPQVEEVLALAAVARPVALPGADVRQVMFHLHALAQRGAARRCLLALPQLSQEVFVGVDAHAAPVWAVGTLRAQGANGTGLGGELHHPPGHKGHLDLAGALDQPACPIQVEGRLSEVRPLAHRPRFAEDGQLRTTLPIRRVVGPEDVAALAVHLMTNTAVTGATYDIDGGQQLISGG